MKYEPDAERLTVEDVFDSGGCLIEENLVTQGNVKIENGSVIVSSMSVIGDHNSGEIKKEADEKCGKECVSEGGKIYACRITPENGFSDLKITEEPFMNHEGRPETVKRIIWKVAEGGQTGKIVCRFTIEPVN